MVGDGRMRWLPLVVLGWGLVAAAAPPPPLPEGDLVPLPPEKSQTAVQPERVIAVANRAVAISPRVDRPWRIDDEVCVLRDEAEIACGKVVKALPKGAIVRLSRMEETPFKGDKVVLAGTAALRAPSQSSTESVRPSLRKPRAVHLGVGGFGSPNYFIPTVSATLNIAGPLSLGVQAGYLGTTTTNFNVTAIPVLALLAYHSRGDFHGLWGQLALGTYFYSVTSTTVSESPMTLSAYLTLGYRFQIASFLTVGLAGGGKYLPSPQSASVELDFSSIQPIGMAELGVKF